MSEEMSKKMRITYQNSFLKINSDDEPDEPQPEEVEEDDDWGEWDDDWGVV